jgi:hypothetical protein
MKKLSKLQKKIKKEEFIKTYSPSIIEKYYPNVKIFPHFIKIEIGGVECDYYPGAERINRITSSNGWSDLNHQDFLALLQIPLQVENFSTREEVLSLNNIGLFNGDLD